VRTLGGLRQTNDGEARPLRRKPLALLSYVARRGPGAVTRTELATLFWGERGEERARQSLRQALLELKQALGDTIEIDVDTVRLTGGAVQLDVAEFERDLASGRVQEAVGRWTGDFFEGAEDTGGEGFRRWIDNERASLHRQLGTAMERLIGDAELAGDWLRAAAWAQRWAAALPFEEAAHLRLIESLRMSGRGNDALKTHAAFVTRLRAALDVEPSPEFMRLGGGLADGAREELSRRGRGSAAVLSPSLVGRGAVMAELLDAWKTASAGTPVVVLLEGGAGQGLTRVCEELASRVRATGIILEARAAGVATDFATARELFEGIRRAEGSAGAAPEALAEVARIVPSLTAEFRFLPTAVGDDATLRDALVQTLAAVAEEQPVLVVLDDAHAADEATGRLLLAVSQRLTGRVMLLLAVSDAERQSNAVLGALRASRGVRQIRLSALTVADVEAMLESMMTMDQGDRRSLAVRLHAETTGVPHDVRALVAALVDDGLIAPDAGGTWRPSPVLAGRALPLPQAVRDRVRDRVDRVSVPARSLAAAFAVLAGPVESAVATAVAELEPNVAESALGELVTRQLLRESPALAGSYELASPLVARTVAALLPVTTRESLHARSAEVLSERDLASTAERSLLPYHLARATTTPGAAVTPAANRGARNTPRYLLIGVPVAAAIALAAVAMRSGSRIFAPANESTVPIVALGRIADYRQPTSANLTKPLTDMLATNLGRVGRLRVVSSARMYELVSQSGRPADTSDAAIVQAARRAGATELVDGALYARDDGGFRLDLRRTELSTGNIRKTYSVVGGTLFELADSGTARVAADFGETAPIGSIADVTTRSVSAYKLYEQGLRAFYANDFRAALPMFEAALKEDSTFAMAAYYSGISAVTDNRLRVARLNLAARLAERTTDRERLTILAEYAYLASSPTLRALAETLSVRYPDEVEGYYFTGLSLMQEGEFLSAIAPFNKAVAMDSFALDGTRARCLACDAMRQVISSYQLADSLPAAERETRRWIRIQPRSSVPWHTLAEVLSQSGKYREAIAAVDREAAFDDGRREAERLLVRAQHYIYAGDFEQADRLLAGEVESASPFRALTAEWYRSISYRQQGRLVDALAASRRHRSLAFAAYPPRASAGRRAAAPEALAEAQVLLEMGKYRASAAVFDSISRWVVGDEMQSHLAHARAWALTHAAGALIAGGDTAGIESRIDTIRAVGSQSLLARDVRLHHHVRGLLLAQRGQDEAAAEELRRAIASWSFGYTRTNIALATVLLRVGRPKEAVAVLQSALHGSIESSNFYVTRTEIHEMLADAWAAVQEPAARDSARANYAYVARAWKRADPSFAVRRARADSLSKR
jgi:DNA-binding SARP family transcriptional activator